MLTTAPAQLKDLPRQDVAPGFGLSTIQVLDAFPVQADGRYPSAKKAFLQPGGVGQSLADAMVASMGHPAGMAERDRLTARDCIAEVLAQKIVADDGYRKMHNEGRAGELHHLLQTPDAYGFGEKLTLGAQNLVKSPEAVTPEALVEVVEAGASPPNGLGLWEKPYDPVKAKFWLVGRMLKDLGAPDAQRLQRLVLYRRVFTVAAGSGYLADASCWEQAFGVMSVLRHSLWELTTYPDNPLRTQLADFVNRLWLLDGFKPLPPANVVRRNDSTVDQAIIALTAKRQKKIKPEPQSPRVDVW